MNNLVVFIRFSDEDVSVFTQPVSTYMNMLKIRPSAELAAELLPGSIVQCVNHQLASFPTLQTPRLFVPGQSYPELLSTL